VRVSASLHARQLAAAERYTWGLPLVGSPAAGAPSVPARGVGRRIAPRAAPRLRPRDTSLARPSSQRRPLREAQTRASEREDPIPRAWVRGGAPTTSRAERQPKIYANAAFFLKPSGGHLAEWSRDEQRLR
jgi:hypothetical protein